MKKIQKILLLLLASSSLLQARESSGALSVATTGGDTAAINYVYDAGTVGATNPVVEVFLKSDVSFANPKTVSIAAGTGVANFSGLTANTDYLAWLKDSIGVKFRIPFATTAVTLSKLEVSPVSASINVGSTQQYAATATYSDNTMVNVTDSATWTSSTSSVATIIGKGLASGKAAGNANIVAVYNGKSATAALTVKSSVADQIVVTPNPLNLKDGEIKPLTAMMVYGDGRPSVNITNLATWNSLQTRIATVTSRGLVAGQSAGTGTIMVSYQGVVGAATVNVTDTAPVVTSLVVTPAGSSIKVGDTKQFTATATYSNNTTANVTSLATWSSSNTAVAIVAGKGLFSGKATGSSSIMASYGGKQATATLTVESATVVVVVTKLVISPANATISIGGTQKFTATATYSDNKTADVTNSATWSSSNTTVSAITGKGTVNGKVSGSSTITASHSGKSATAALTVKAASSPVPVSYYTVPSPIRVYDSMWSNFKIYGRWADGRVTDVSGSVANPYYKWVDVQFYCSASGCRTNNSGKKCLADTSVYMPMRFGTSSSLAGLPYDCVEH